MSDRASKILKDDMEALGPVRLRDVDEAQSAIVVLAKELSAQGQIEIAESKDEEMIY
jgi:flagellar motor switch protein FliG